MQTKTYKEIEILLKNIKFEQYETLGDNIKNLRKLLVWIYISLKITEFRIPDIEKFIDLLNNYNENNVSLVEVKIYSDKHKNDHNLFKEKSLMNPKASAILEYILSKQIYELEGISNSMYFDSKIADEWENFIIINYLNAWIRWLIDHFWKEESIFNETVLCYFFELGKSYE